MFHNDGKISVTASPDQVINDSWSLVGLEGRLEMKILKVLNLEEEVKGCKTGSKYRSDLNNIEFQALSVSNQRLKTVKRSSSELLGDIGGAKQEADGAPAQQPGQQYPPISVELSICKHKTLGANKSIKLLLRTD